MSPTPDEDRALQDVANRLRRQFAAAPPEEIDRRVASARERFAGAPIRQYLPVIIARTVADELGRPDRG